MTDDTDQKPWKGFIQETAVAIANDISIDIQQGRSWVPSVQTVKVWVGIIERALDRGGDLRSVHEKATLMMVPVEEYRRLVKYQQDVPTVAEELRKIRADRDSLAVQLVNAKDTIEELEASVANQEDEEDSP
jgi:hypothetical protein